MFPAQLLASHTGRDHGVHALHAGACLGKGGLVVQIGHESLGATINQRLQALLASSDHPNCFLLIQQVACDYMPCIACCSSYNVHGGSSIPLSMPPGGGVMQQASQIVRCALP